MLLALVGAHGKEGGHQRRRVRVLLTQAKKQNAARTLMPNGIAGLNTTPTVLKATTMAKKKKFPKTRRMSSVRLRDHRERQT